MHRSRSLLWVPAAVMTLLDTTDGDLLASPAHERERTTSRVRAHAWSRSTCAITVAAVIGLVALAFARWQVAGAVVPWDSKNHFYPMFRFLGEALGRGVVPLWNPYHFAGYPAVADPQSLIFTPSLAACAWLWPHASMAAFDALIAAHLAAGGVGMLGLGRRRRWHPEAALLAAVVFMFGGSAAARLQHTGMIVSYSFFPLALWALQAALDRRSIGVAILAGVLTALMALGRDQVAFLLCLVIASSVIQQAFRSADALTYLRERALVICTAALVTAAIMVVPILLTLQFIRDSNRPGIAYGVALEGSLNPVNLLTLFAPNIFGSLDSIYDYWGPGAATAAGNDWTDRSIDYLFVGTLPLVLIVWHGLAGARAFERGARFYALIVATTLLYAFGRFTPAFSIAFDWVPGVSLYRRPADATFITNIGLACLGGYLLHRFIVSGSPSARPHVGPGMVATILTLLSAAVLMGFGLAFAAHADRLGRSALALLSSVPWVVGVVGALLLFGSAKRRRIGALVLLLVTAGQLIWRNAASPLNAEPASTYSAYDGLYPDQARGLAVLKTELAARSDHPRVEILGLDGSWQNASMVFKLQDTAGYNPLRIAAYEHAVGVAESASDLNLRTFPDTFRGYNSRLGALLGLDYLVLDSPVSALPRSFPRPRGTLLFAGDHFYVYRLEHTAPTARAYLATHLTAIDSRAAIDASVLPSFDAQHEALLDFEDARLLHDKALLENAPAVSKAKVSIASYDDNRVVLDVNSPVAGVLVLHDLAYPGWETRVDQMPMPILRANLLFRGVEVPAGHHRVEFFFHPFSLANLAKAAGDLMNKGSK